MSTLNERMERAKQMAAQAAEKQLKEAKKAQYRHSLEKTQRLAEELRELGIDPESLTQNVAA